MNEQRLIIHFANALQIMEVSAPPPPSVRTLITITHEGLVLTTEGNHVMYTLPVDHFVKMQVTYVDSQGNPATVDGDVSWASSDDAIATVNVDDVDSTIVAVTPKALGNVQITATADADIGEGTRELITTADISVVAGEAVAGSIQPVGPPEPIPSA